MADERLKPEDFPVHTEQMKIVKNAGKTIAETNNKIAEGDLAQVAEHSRKMREVPRVAAIRKRYRIEFESLGVAGVQERLIIAGWNAEKSAHAKRWLDENDQAVNRELARELISTASEAVLAARSQAHIAKAALTIAIIALIISIVSFEPISKFIASNVVWPSWFSQQK